MVIGVILYLKYRTIIKNFSSRIAQQIIGLVSPIGDHGVLIEYCQYTPENVSNIRRGDGSHKVIKYSLVGDAQIIHILAYALHNEVVK